MQMVKCAEAGRGQRFQGGRLVDFQEGKYTTMVHMRLFLTSLVLSVTIVLGASSIAAWSANLESFTLGNGLQVIMVENHRLPMVSHMVWYRVGSADDPPGQSGLAHLLEHMMFKGTKAVPAEEYSQIIARNGGIENAATTFDYTIYYQIIAADRLELVMQREADRMLNLAFDATAFRTEHDVVREERRSYTDNVPEALLDERIQMALWGEHPYRNPVIGWDHELKTLTAEETTTFYSQWYAPNNAIVVVAGDVTVDQVRLLAEKHYGVLPKRNVPTRVRPRDLLLRADTIIEMHHQNVHQPSWSRVYIALSHNLSMECAACPYALRVLTELFGSGRSSRLYQSLVIRQKLAVEAGIFYDEDRVDFGMFSIFASPQPGVQMPVVIEAVEVEIRRLLKEGVTPGEVARAKSSLRAGDVYLRDSLERGAWVVGEAISLGRSAADIVAWPERIAAVTPEEVMAVARLVLEESQHVSGLLLPLATVPVIQKETGTLSTS